MFMTASDMVETLGTEVALLTTVGDDLALKFKGGGSELLLLPSMFMPAVVTAACVTVVVAVVGLTLVMGLT